MHATMHACMLCGCSDPREHTLRLHPAAHDLEHHAHASCQLASVPRHVPPACGVCRLPLDPGTIRELHRDATLAALLGRGQLAAFDAFAAQPGAFVALDRLVGPLLRAGDEPRALALLPAGGFLERGALLAAISAAAAADAPAALRRLLGMVPRRDAARLLADGPFAVGPAQCAALLGPAACTHLAEVIA